MRSNLRLLVFSFVLLVSLTCAGSSGFAQGAASSETAIELTPAQVQQLTDRLSKGEIRLLLVPRDGADASAIAANAAGSDRGLSERIETTATRIRTRLWTVFGAAPQAAHTLSLIKRRLDQTEGFGVALLTLVAVLAVSTTAYWLWHRWTRRRQDRFAKEHAEAGPYASVAAFGNALGWLVLELSSVLVYFATAIVLAFGIQSDALEVRQFLAAYVTALGATLAVAAIVEFCLPRNWPTLRLLALSDKVVLRVKTFAVALAAIWTVGFFTGRLLLRYGAEPAPRAFLIICVATVFILVLIALILSLRRDIAALILGDGDVSSRRPSARRLLANSWHYLAIAYVGLVWLLTISRHLLSEQPIEGISGALIGLGLFVAVPALDVMIGRYIAAQFGAASALAEAARRTFRVFLVVGAAAVFFTLWGVDTEYLRAAGVAGWVIGAVANIGAVVLVGYAAWQLARAYFNILLTQQGPSDGQPSEAAAQAEGEGGGGGATRAATLLPLLRNAAAVTIVVMAALTALTRLGVDIAPLLAGAGVVGLSVGFGAQRLVRDIVSGIFFLIDDAFRTGEYVDVGKAQGRVEKISVRSLRLRHHRGPVHVVPFGEIQTLTNYSRDWVIMKLPLRLTYDTDPQRVKKIVKRIGAEMAADPTLGPMLLEPPKSQGVLQMDDSAMVFRVKFMAKPGEQFVLRRELLHRIHTAFAKEGITFATREVTVRVADRPHDGQPDSPEEESEEKIGAAAARAVIDQETAAR